LCLETFSFKVFSTDLEKTTLRADFELEADPFLFTLEPLI
jgi:hypothetical protein